MATTLEAVAHAASFLGAQALKDGGVAPLDILGLVAFSATLLASAWVLLPRRRLIFGLDGPTLYSALWDYGDDLAEVERRLAYWLHGFYERNEPAITRLFGWFAVATVALLLEVLLWATSLAVT